MIAAGSMAVSLPADGGAMATALKPGGFFFSSPSGVRLAPPGHALAARVREGHGAAVHALCVAAQRQGQAEPLVFGLVPFQAGGEAVFHAPTDSRRYGRAQVGPVAPGRPRRASRQPGIEWPDRAGYEDMVRRAVAMIAAGMLDKVVLSRTLSLTLDVPVDYAALVLDLLCANRDAYVYALPSETGSKAAGGAMLVGASPELLVRRAGGRLTVNPLAGSVPRQADPVRDAEAAAALARSDKDLREHAFVVDRLRQQLAPLCAELHVPERPTVVGTDRLWHLSTLITAVPRDSAQGALDVALALHPTPAICGSPTPAASQAIQQLEPFERGYFSGLVGWQDARGDGEWAIALRCAQCQGHRLQLFAGAGIVAGSDPYAEYVETGAKLSTLMDAVLRSQSFDCEETV